ncbi:MAG: helix-turn-helix domain-containing protein [Burkholderiaceae bacterium]|nr:helix-turn-helix domain-containing protein [Burkholderiaceae bacterium]
MSPFLDTDFAPLDSERTAQQVRVLEALKQGPRTTLELRQMGVANCAARVLELRRQGLDILTARAGRFACYVLRGGAT